MKSRRRAALALIVLALSLSLLVWGLWPASRERRVLPVEPSNLTLPTPSSFLPFTLVLC
jgi:hypothetical protein